MVDYPEVESATLPGGLEMLSPDQVREVVAAAEAFNQILKKYGVTEYVYILGVEANRDKQPCFLSKSKSHD